jgi:hypothetical protein
MLRIRAFWAPDDQRSGEKFAEGHFNVLSEIGVKKVTSSSNDWIDSPFVYVVTCENENGEIVGGARLHIAAENTPLPMQLAIARVDPQINEYVEEEIPRGTCELCGLWNSKKVAGRGLGIRLIPMACIAISYNIQLNSIFALVAKHTLKPSMVIGFDRFEKVGDRGEFNYPKLDLVATTAFIEDTKDLPHVKQPDIRELMYKMREEKQFVEHIEHPKGEYKVEFDLDFNEAKWKNIRLSKKESD